MDELLVESDNIEQFLSFSLGRELYGVPIATVREVIEYHRISTVPLACDIIQGVMNLRGNVITVIDLSARLYGRKKTDVDNGVVIIAEIEDEGMPIQIGMLIDGVNAVVDLARESVENEPEFGAKIRSDFIARIGKKNGEFIIILDVMRVLNLEEFSEQNQRSAESAGSVGAA